MIEYLSEIPLPGRVLAPTAAHAGTRSPKSASLGFIAVLAGWTTTEVGRQPWTVYGLLRTADSVSPSLTGSDVLISLIGYTIAYLVIFPAGLFIMARFVRKGLEEAEGEPEEIESGRPGGPVRALPGSAQRQQKAG